jgi:DNA-binding NarL/FixJ family response regulator
MSTPIRILIVDDNDCVRQFVRAFLEIHSDFVVCGEAADGVEGIEKAVALMPDLIVLDLSMPRMDGLETATALQQTMPRVPIILFTLYVDETLGHRARAAGIASVLSKMDSMEALRIEVRRLTARPAA